MIWFACADACRPINSWVCREELRAHEVVSSKAEGAEDTVLIRCTNCEGMAVIDRAEWQQVCHEQDSAAARTRRAGLTKYPRIEPQSGALVNSREDERRVWKAKGYHEAPHGVDERTWTEADYRVKEQYKKRTPGWRNMKAQALAGKIPRVE